MQLALHILDTNLSRLRWQAVISPLFLFSHCPPASAAWTSPTSELGSLELIRQETAAVTVGINSLAGIAFTGTTPTPTHFNLQNFIWSFFRSQVSEEYNRDLDQEMANVKMV